MIHRWPPVYLQALVLKKAALDKQELPWNKMQSILFFEECNAFFGC